MSDYGSNGKRDEWKQSDRSVRNRTYRSKGFRDERRHGYHHPHSSRPIGKPSYRKERREQKPQPINGKCNPLCPFFWCGKRAYQIRRDPVTGRKYVYCTWIGDECIGASCQYASCRLNYLLPDGSCAYAKQKESRMSGDMMEELEKDEVDKHTRDVIYKRFGKKRYEDIL